MLVNITKDRLAATIAAMMHTKAMMFAFFTIEHLCFSNDLDLSYYGMCVFHLQTVLIKSCLVSILFSIKLKIRQNRHMPL
jgi:hypothetical protein